MSEAPTPETLPAGPEQEAAPNLPNISTADLTMAKLVNNGHFYVYQQRGYFRVARYLDGFTLDGKPYNQGGFLVVPEDGSKPTVFTDDALFRRTYRITPPAKRLEPD